MNTCKLLLLLPSLALGVPADAAAQETCEDVARPLEGGRLLRRLSLDLRGHIPTSDEVAGAADFDVHADLDAVIDAYMDTPEFIEVMRDYHRSLLWPNLNQSEAVSQLHVLYQGFPYVDENGQQQLSDIYWSPLRAVYTRNAGEELFPPCLPEPATFDAGGNLLVTPRMELGEITAYQEGYVEVEPYWAPGTTVRVCGFDAQGLAAAPACPGPADRFPFIAPFCEQAESYDPYLQTPFVGYATECNGPLALYAPGCGCGPNLRYCHTIETALALRDAVLDQQLRLVDDVIRTDAPYFDILTRTDTEVNGIIAHYLRYQSRESLTVFGEDATTYPVPAELDYASPYDHWVRVEQDDKHAGVLTSVGYLLRFVSNRGRAHRFYNAFQCASFIPNGPLPSPFEACSKHENLTQRCGCDACHQTLEPLSAHWGRFAEYGYGILHEEEYPATIGPSCMPPWRDLLTAARCLALYETEPVGEEVEYANMLNSYVFRTRDDIISIEEGPARLVARAFDDGSLARCVVRRMWAHFMRRMPTDDEEAWLVPELVSTFEANDYALRPLIAAILRMPAYRRLP